MGLLAQDFSFLFIIISTHEVVTGVNLQSSFRWVVEGEILRAPI